MIDSINIGFPKSSAKSEYLNPKISEGIIPELLSIIIIVNILFSFHLNIVSQFGFLFS
jgi:hypothetical protein